jgi:hypothetical protein
VANYRFALQIYGSFEYCQDTSHWQRFRKPLLGRVLRKSIEDRLDGFKGI